MNSRDRARRELTVLGEDFIDPTLGLGQATGPVKALSQILIPLALLAFGCGDKLDAHLDKFMETGPGRTADFGNPPDAYALAESDSVADRIHSMTFAERSQRIGAHRYQAQTEFRFRSPKHFTSLKEQALIVQAANGDFRIKLDNDSGQGYELVWAGGELFVRTRFGPFHRRSAQADIHTRQRDQAHGSWGAIHRLFRGRLLYSKTGMTRHFGRDALKFSISLSQSPARLPGTPEQPRVPAGVTGYVYPIEPTPAEQDRWRDKAAPVQAGGSLLVDIDTGVVLQVEFAGQLAWQSDAGEPFGLEVKARIESDGFGNPPSLAPPDEKTIEPLPERIQVDTRPLDFFFGKGFTAGLGPPAGVARRQATGVDPATLHPGPTPSAP